MEKQLTNTSDAVNGIGSATKSFIVAGIARFLEDEKLTWGTLVRDILLEFEQEDANMIETLTIINILSHQSGLAGSGDVKLAFRGDSEMWLPKKNLFSIVRQLSNYSQFE